MYVKKLYVCSLVVDKQHSLVPRPPQNGWSGNLHIPKLSVVVAMQLRVKGGGVMCPCPHLYFCTAVNERDLTLFAVVQCLVCVGIVVW